MKERKAFNYKEAYTHSGTFHADDVFATALIEIIAEKQQTEVSVKRESLLNPELMSSNCLIFDIGGGRYDHHQPDAEIRKNGVKYAAFGLLWRDFGYILCDGFDIENEIDTYLIQPLDTADNYGGFNAISQIINHFNPNWNQKSDDIDKNLREEFYAFCNAVNFAKTILKNEISNQISIYLGKDLIKKALEKSDGEILVFEDINKVPPWKNSLIESNIKFVVYPSNRGGWNAQVVPISKEDNTAKCDFPKEWAGLRDNEIQRVSGIKDLIFCHNSLFLCASNTKESALEACKRAITGI